MKRFLAILICLISYLSIWAQVVPNNRVKSMLGGNARLAYVARTDSLSDFYVFNRADNKGYVILTADVYSGEQIVLGYSDEGTFNYDNLPDNARWWLHQYQLQIEQARRDKVVLRTARNSENDESRRVEVYPLLGAIKWVQTFPFNNKSPKKYNSESKKDENCLTGCAANAMGQIMCYYKWPLNPVGSHSYKWNGETLSSDFSKSVYDWAVIKDRYVVGQISTVEANAISQLMYDCGIALDMEYDLGGSSAFAEDIPNALKRYFKYKSASIVYRDQHSDIWDELLREQLSNSQPVIYGGTDADAGGEGHAFVCDGFDSEGYFHFNFGWGGLADGYYLSSLSDSYTFNQVIVCNIVPDRQKYKSGKLFYNPLNKGDVEISYPESLYPDYSGEIEVPAVVGGYNVISIGSRAFMGSSVTKVVLPSTVNRISGSAFSACRELDTLVVNWNSPLSCDVSVFDNETYSNTVLVVPSGKVPSYTSVQPWSLFSHITDENTTNEWSEWIPMECGTGNYSSGLYIFGSSEVNVLWRVSDKDSNKAQIKIDGVFTGTSLMVDVDLQTGACRVPKQSTGFMNGSDEVIISDCPSFSKSASYEQFPCVYNDALGRISMYVVYSSGAHDGQYYICCEDVLQLDMKREWQERYTGTYHYSTYIKQSRSNVKLYQDALRPSCWRLYPMQNDAEFVFVWKEDGILEFGSQDSGFRSASDDMIIVDDLKKHSPSVEPSKYDISTNTLFFNTLYYCVGEENAKGGKESYVIEAESAVDEIQADTWKGDMIYNVAGQPMSTPRKGINIRDGYKFLVE